MKTRIIIAVCAVLLAAVAATTAAGTPGTRHVLNVRDGGFDITFANNASAPERIEKIYSLERIPDGFSISFRSSNPSYVINSYTDGNKSFDFTQAVSRGFKSGAITDAEYTVTELKIGGSGAVLYKTDGFVKLILDRDGYVFTIRGDISSEEAISIAEGIRS